MLELPTFGGYGLGAPRSNSGGLLAGADAFHEDANALVLSVGWYADEQLVLAEDSAGRLLLKRDHSKAPIQNDARNGWQVVAAVREHEVNHADADDGVGWDARNDHAHPGGLWLRGHRVKTPERARPHVWFRASRQRWP